MSGGAPRAAALGSPPTPAEIRDRDRRFVWHTWSPIAADVAEVTLSHGDGYRVWDADGREYIDACSLNSTCGYAHPHVVQAVSGQLARLHTTDLSLATHELAGALAERLAGYLPGDAKRTLLVNSGSEGIEAAVMIATAFWSHTGRPRSRVVAFADAYHGATAVARSMSALPRSGHPFDPPMPATLVRLPAAPAQLRLPEALPSLVAAFERAIGDDPDDLPAAVIVEPFLNVGGGVVLPPGFLGALRRLCDEAGSLLVLDEVFTGIGRTGRMFACLHEDVEPDILVASKGLAGGYVPIAAVMVREHVYESFAADPVIGGLRYGHTTSGHAAGCAAALATLDVVEGDGLVERAEVLGARLLEQLAAATRRHDVTDIRGLGLIAMVELPSAGLAAQVVAAARGRGLLVRQKGPSIMVVPPLTIDAAGIASIAGRLGGALDEAAAG